MQPDSNDTKKGIDLTIHLDEADAQILFLLAIHAGQSLEDIILGMMEETTSDLLVSNIQQPTVEAAIEEYKRTGQFDSAKWHL